MPLYGYFMLNVALMLGYLLTRAVINLPLLKNTLLQSQRLKFARYSFIAALCAIFIGQCVTKILSKANVSTFNLQPIVKIATSPFSGVNTSVSGKMPHMESFATLPSFENILCTLLVVGFAFYLIKYLINIFKLKKIVRDSSCLHRVNNIHIVVNDDTAIPFCWSLFQKHYVVIPAAYLEKAADLQVAIRHELQHIRQFDTSWLHIITIVKILCFWNPVMKRWIAYFDELQEFACDEALMLQKKASPAAYAQCLVDAASGLLNATLLPEGALGINGFSNSILYRRVNMLFDYTPRKMQQFPLVIASAITAGLLAVTSIAFASSALPALSMQQVEKLIHQSNINQEFQVSANQAVVDELNNIRGSEQARSYLQAALVRMDKHLPLVNAALSARNMPKELSVIPLVESGYQPLEEKINPVKAAGIWQIIPATAKRLGLKMNHSQDERMNMPRATQAALTLLSDDYKIYKNWKLAFVAYEIGEKATDALIKQTGSRDAWVLANSPKAPPTLKNILATFDAELIIMQNPSLINA